MAVLSSSVQALLATAQVPELGPGPRTGVDSESTLERKLKDVFFNSTIQAENQELVRALVLLWHDHLDSAHALAQDIQSPEGAFVHAIMHRREPDFSNSKYWFHRVGKHPAFALIANGVEEILRPQDVKNLHSTLLPDSHWDPFAFVDACQKSTRTGELREVLRQIQAVEIKSLLFFLSTDEI
jgi:hypothetical protein